MTLSNDLREKYEAVLRDLESERQQVHQQITPLQARLKELHSSIVTLSKRLDPNAVIPRLTNAHKGQSLKYANISVRWATLDVLKDSQRPMSTSEIAESHKTGGIQTRAANFANNVSAVLSTNMKEHAEVQQLPDGTWELTETGESAIEHIRTTPRFRRGVLS